jgi:hypothetical protein
MHMGGQQREDQRPYIAMCSNRTSILRIDQALIPLLGFDANNKKIITYVTLNCPRSI